LAIRPLDSDEPSEQQPLPPTRPSRVLMHSLRYITLAWAFGAAWMYITTGAALTRAAQLFGMPAFGFGLLAALPYAGSLMQVPASYLIEKYGHRKPVFLVSGLVHRALWFAIAAIPWLIPPEAWWIALLVLLASSSFLGHVSSPGVMAWFGDVIPRPVRGRYFSRRMQVGQLTGLMATLLVGWALDRTGAVDEHSLRVTVSALFAVAALVGVIDYLLLVRLPDPSPDPPSPKLSLLSMIKAPLADRRFRRYLGFNMTLTFSLGYVGQFIWLYVFDVVEMTNAQANLMLVGIPLIISMLSVRFWGNLIDQHGRLPVLAVCGVCIIFGGASWVFVTKESWWLGYSASTISMFAFPGMDLANLNLLLGLTRPPGTRRQNSAYLAVNSVAIAVAGMLSGVFGGLVARNLEGWTGSLFGWPLTYHGLLLLISSALRGLSLLWLIGMEDQGAHSTRMAIRQVRANIYSNMQQAFLLPMRRLGSMRRNTFRVRGFLAVPRIGRTR
jgi:MFS family permease